MTEQSDELDGIFEQWLADSSAYWEANAEKPSLDHAKYQIIQEMVRSKGGHFELNPHILMNQITFLTANQDKAGDLILSAPLKVAGALEDNSYIAEHILSKAEFKVQLRMFKRVVRMKPLIEKVIEGGATTNYLINAVLFDLTSGAISTVL